MANQIIISNAFDGNLEKSDDQRASDSTKSRVNNQPVASFDGAMAIYNYGIKLWNEIDKNDYELAPFYKAGALYQASYNPYVDEWVDVQLLAYIDKSEELRRLDEILCEIFFED